VVTPRPSWIQDGLTGTEHIGPEDTWDGDYGRLLARACEKVRRVGKGLATLEGFEPSIFTLKG
jgi:hypothetical protein